MSVFDRLRRQTTTDAPAESAVDADQDGASADEDVDAARSSQPADVEASTPPSAANHVPDAARSFDPWGRRASSALSTQVWVDGLMGSRQR